MSTPSIIKTPTIIEQNIITEEDGVKTNTRTIFLQLPFSGGMSVRLRIATSGSIDYWRERFEKFMSEMDVKDKTLEDSRRITSAFFDSIIYGDIK